MAGIFKKVQEKWGGSKPTEFEDEVYFDDYEDGADEGYEDNYIEDEEEPTSAPGRRVASNIYEMNTGSPRTTDMTMIIFKPDSYGETQVVVDNLKVKKPTVINLDDMDTAEAQRALDFISGAVYALSGDIRKAARNIFVVAPSNIDIQSVMKDAEKSKSDPLGF